MNCIVSADIAITPLPVGGQGIVFGLFLCFFVSNVTRKRLDRFA